MTIRHIVLRKGTYYFYGDYSERNLIATVSQKELGEVVGYNHEYMLCLKGNKYAVCSLGKEEVMSFCAFTNLYPMKISFTIGNIRDCVRVEDEDDEARWRKLIRQIKGCPGRLPKRKLKQSWSIWMKPVLPQALSHSIVRVIRTSRSFWIRL